MTGSQQDTDSTVPPVPILNRSILPRPGNQRSVTTRPSPPRRTRVGRACFACRQRRIKCSGDKPACENCVTQGIECRAWETKQARTKRRLETLQDQNNSYEQLLQEISGRVGSHDALRIQSALDSGSRSSEDATQDGQLLPQAPPGRERRTPLSRGASGGDDSDSSSLGSLEGEGRVEEDLDRDDKSRATGFIGKSSEIAWLQSMGQNSMPPIRVEPPRVREKDNLTSEGKVFEEAPPGSEHSKPPVSSLDYHLDDLGLNTSQAVDPYDLPSKLVADSLLDTYFSSVHPSFPILHQASILSGTTALYDGSSSQPDSGWLAVLHLLFAIAAKCSFSTTRTQLLAKRAHVDYFTRAKALFLDRDILFSHADILEIQFLGLLSFYLLSVGQLNRSWKVSGLAIRSAFALGLNLKDTAPQVASEMKEERYGIWWSLFVLEHLLGTMTGRYSYITESSHTTPLPLPFDEDTLPDDGIADILNDYSVRKSYLETPHPVVASGTPKTELQVFDTLSTAQTQAPATKWLQSIAPSESLYFLYFVNLSLIANDARSKLYVPTVTERSWRSIQGDISHLQSRTGSWLSSLPVSFDFCNSPAISSFPREKLSLAFLFYSLEIMLARPCLCRLNDRGSAKSKKRQKYTLQNAASCVEAACSLLELVPDHPDTVPTFLETAPWWCLSHYIMQASVVLVFELSMRSRNLPQKAEQVAELAKRGVWLFRQMSEVSLSAARSWRMLDTFIQQLAPWVSLDMGGLLFEHHSTQDNCPDTCEISNRITSGIVVNEFDEFLPFNPDTGEITGSFFPTDHQGPSWRM